MNKYNFLGFIIGLIFVKLIFNNKEGEPHKLPLNIGSFIKNGSIYIMDKHIHHWLIALIILVFTIPYQIKFKSNLYKIKSISVLNGFLVLFGIHGLSYKDYLEF